MTSLLLLALNLSPGIQLADNISARNVALSDARIRLVSDDEETRPSLDTMTREQLVAELRRLDETRPSLVGPIVLLSVGVALAVPGYIVLNMLMGGLLGSAASITTNGSAVAVMYLAFVGVGVLCIVGIVLVIIGVVKLIKRIIAKGAHNREVDELQNRIDNFQPQQLDQPPPPPPALFPPPPPPPAEANLVVPGGLRTVMTF